MPTHKFHQENVSMPKEAQTQFAYDEDGCPLLPNINVDKVTVEGLRKLLADYVEAQWGMSIFFFFFLSTFNSYLSS